MARRQGLGSGGWGAAAQARDPEVSAGSAGRDDPVRAGKGRREGGGLGRQAGARLQRQARRGGVTPRARDAALLWRGGFDRGYFTDDVVCAATRAVGVARARI